MSARLQTFLLPYFLKYIYLIK